MKKACLSTDLRKAFTQKFAKAKKKVTGFG